MAQALFLQALDLLNSDDEDDNAMRTHVLRFILVQQQHRHQHAALTYTLLTQYHTESVKRMFYLKYVGVVSCLSHAQSAPSLPPHHHHHHHLSLLSCIPIPPSPPSQHRRTRETPLTAWQMRMKFVGREDWWRPLFRFTIEEFFEVLVPTLALPDYFYCEQR